MHVTKNLVTIQEAKAVTSSLQVANTFEKRHSDVIRSIESIITQLPKNQCERIFALAYNQVKQPSGGFRNEPYYVMNRDGFTLLAMGFTGKKALQFKICYIDAFNKMEEYIKQQSQVPVYPTLLKRKATGKRVETYLPNEDVLRLQIAAHQEGHGSVYQLLQCLIYDFLDNGNKASLRDEIQRLEKEVEYYENDSNWWRGMAFSYLKMNKTANENLLYLSRRLYK